MKNTATSVHDDKNQHMIASHQKSEYGIILSQSLRIDFQRLHPEPLFCIAAEQQGYSRSRTIDCKKIAWVVRVHLH
jgi:hypothetical protein